MLANSPRVPIGRAERQIDEAYRYYRVVAGQKGDAFAAVAYAGKLKAFSTTGESLETTIDGVHQLIDEDFDRRLQKRKDGKPSAQDFERALDLGHTRRTAVQQHLLERMWHIGDKPMSLDILQARSEFSTDAIMRAIVRLARQMADILGLTIAAGPNSGASAMAVLVDASAEEFDFSGIWVLNVEFYRALKRHMEKG